ncbi:hypothetical protein D5086_017445 [Populus alba]|uniref:Uncharacterized protein n=1 Tax=Populus alba TaxID=43335 RepID=A0ACC4BZI2_POPAL
MVLIQSFMASHSHAYRSPSGSFVHGAVLSMHDVVNFNCEAKVRTKHRKRDIQGTPPTAPPSSSPKPYENTSTSLVFIRPCRDPSAETGSLSSWFGAGNPNHGPPVGTAPSPPPYRKSIREELPSEPEIDPMAAEAAVAVEESVGALSSLACGLFILLLIQLPSA